MEINTFAVQAYNNPYVPLSSPPSQSGINFEEPGAFGQLLKKAEESKRDSSAETLPSSSFITKKDEIDKSGKLYEACMELETFLIKNLIKSMRSTVQKSNLIDEGFAGGMYEDMLYDEYAKSFTKNANLGFAEMAYRELSGMR